MVLDYHCLRGLQIAYSMTVAIVCGYEIAEYFDQQQAKKARPEILDDVMFGWEPSKDAVSALNSIYTFKQDREEEEQK